MKQMLKRLAKHMMLALYFVERKVFPIQRDCIVFESNVGRNYTGNPKSIYEEMVTRGLDKIYRCYFVLEDRNIEVPGAAKKIKRKGLKYFHIMAIAGVWVCDSRLPAFIVKRKGVTYIQTWHGTPLKKLALDMDEVSMSGEVSIEDYKQKFYANAQTWDYLISQNHYSTEIFRRAFGFQKKILEIGYPRNDALINQNTSSIISAIKKRLKLPLDKKVILYAPTWRDDEFYENGKYKFVTKIDFKQMQDKLQQDYILIVKYHYLVNDMIDWKLYQGFIYDFDSKEDIKNLYLVADLLVTDYSSVMFDYSLLKRPMLFFTYDLEKYKNSLRGFYFDLLEEAPGPISQTTDELIEGILDYDFSLYEKKYQYFMEKYNHLDRGTASSQVVDLILEQTKVGGS